ncbi:hypothetical protein [Pseudolysinimonas yzui]|uniref:Uncharacterized protein n=1 Tax=Pseudolysinimonas yzui TaxID=2708254 RepID=A0A8J3M1V3_9MICO|nr:hypothetical protein [Pseudolysinimonas yzui]GHF20440.1 hypothetical protein GCM10011600_21760 [Pseudolysinimonas yzui]
MTPPQIGARALVAVLIVVGLAACTPSSPSGPDAPPADVKIDPWLADDLDVDSAIITGGFMGVALTGFTCDVSASFAANGDGDVRPTAGVTVTVAGSSISYTEETLSAVAQGPDVPPTGGIPATVTVTTTHGGWDIGDGGANTDWTPTTVLTLTEIPIPEDGCAAADMWYLDLTDVGTDTAEIVRAFSEDGLRNVASECPEAWFTWVPPNLSCEEFEARFG